MLLALFLVAIFFAIILFVYKFGIHTVENDAENYLRDLEADAKADAAKVENAVKTKL